MSILVRGRCPSPSSSFLLRNKNSSPIRIVTNKRRRWEIASIGKTPPPPPTTITMTSARSSSSSSIPPPIRKGSIPAPAPHECSQRLRLGQSLVRQDGDRWWQRTSVFSSFNPHLQTLRRHSSAVLWERESQLSEHVYYPSHIKTESIYAND